MSEIWPAEYISESPAGYVFLCREFDSLSQMRFGDAPLVLVGILETRDAAWTRVFRGWLPKDA